MTQEPRGTHETATSPSLLTDRYELTMLTSFVTDGSVHHPAVFEAFARRLPEGRRYGVLAGLGRLLSMVEQFTFDADEVDWLRAEGVVNDATAEPVVYMLDRYVVGGFYRVNADRGNDENLNSPGASFVPLAFAGSTLLPRPGAKPGASAPNRFYMYGVVARLAMVAASYELEATDPDAEIYD